MENVLINLKNFDLKSTVRSTFGFPLLVSLCFFLLIVTGCQTPSTKDHNISLDNYILEPGFDLSVAASEPYIKSPIAIDFDSKGRMWVLEMPGYMPNIDGTGEDEPIGRILILEDSDDDGYYESSTTFIDSLVLARAMKLIYGGLLYAEPPNLWFVEIDGNKPGMRTLVDSTYVAGGNVEHQPNGLDVNIDNWIYSAKSFFRYRKQNDKWLKEYTSFRGQWGISHDDNGRLFYNDNSNPLYGDFLMPNQLNQNPNFKNNIGENEVILKDRRVYPLQATSVNRGYIKGVLDDDKKLVSFTSSCGPVVYRGQQFPEEFDGNAFICGPEANLVKRVLLKENSFSIKGVQAYENKEFLISEDEAFRPVNLSNGPDGSMYVVDYHNGVIQHKVYMTPYLRKQLLEKGLDTIVDYGRILKVSHGDSKVLVLENKTDAELVDLLGHSNGWIRDKAQQMLVHRSPESVISDLKAITLSEDSIKALHAFWTLEGMEKLDSKLILDLLASENNQKIICALQNLNVVSDEAKSIAAISQLISKKDESLNYFIALHASKLKASFFPLIEDLLIRYPQDTILCEMALSGLHGYEKSFLSFLNLKNKKLPTVRSFLDKAIEKSKTKSTLPQIYTDSKTKGLQLYRLHCASCHGENGTGNRNLAPPLMESNYIKGDPDKLIRIVLHGMQGPVTVNGEVYKFEAVMPGLNHNKDLSDQDISNILAFVRNAFTTNQDGITAEQVKALRNDKPKDGMYTEAELLAFEK